MRPVARSVSPIFAAEMKLSFRSKLIALTTPGVSVRRDRPMAESASVLIIPPWTKPEWLAMSSVGVMSTVAVPSPVSTVSRPSQAHNLDTVVTSLTSLSLRHRHACGGSSRDQSPALVDHVGLAEQQRLPHLDHAAYRPNATFDHRPQEVDLQLDRRVPHAVFLQRGPRPPPPRSPALRDHSALPPPHPPATVPVLASGDKLEDDAARLGLGDACAERLHPPVRLRRKQSFSALDVSHRPRRPGR